MTESNHWNENFTRTVIGLAVYLYILGVPPILDNHLAEAYARSVYERLGKPIKS